MKTYVITLSKDFPAKHPRKGEKTHFAHKAIAAINGCGDHQVKLHTIRANYTLWSKRFEQIDRGEACLSVRQWTGKPYASKQFELCKLTKDDGIGIQKMEFLTPKDGYTKDAYVWIAGRVLRYDERELIANNDGLTLDDWESWFANYDKTKPFAVIHFTKFRY